MHAAQKKTAVIKSPAPPLATSGRCTHPADAPLLVLGKTWSMRCCGGARALAPSSCIISWVRVFRISEDHQSSVKLVWSSR